MGDLLVGLGFWVLVTFNRDCFPFRLQFCIRGNSAIGKGWEWAAAPEGESQEARVLLGSFRSCWALVTCTVAGLELVLSGFVWCDFQWLWGHVGWRPREATGLCGEWDRVSGSKMQICSQNEDVAGRAGKYVEGVWRLGLGHVWGPLHQIGVFWDQLPSWRVGSGFTWSP